MDKGSLVALIATLDTVVIIFSVIAAAGVVGGTVTGFLNWRATRDLREMQDKESLVLQDSISKMVEKAESERLARVKIEADLAKATGDIVTARREAADAIERAAESNRIAEGERLARVKIEERLAPRRLTADQLAKIRDLLKPFAAGAIKVAFLCSSDPEPAKLGFPLLAAIREAGWTVSNAFGNNSARAVDAIWVEVSADAEADTRSAAIAFVSAIRSVTGFWVSDPQPLEKIVLGGSFTGEGMPPVKTIEELGKQLDAATIRITIGPK